MSYLLDTDWTIDYLDGNEAAVMLVEQLIPSGVAISMTTYMEIYQGVYRLTDPRTAEQVEQLLTMVPVLPFSLVVARLCARLREDLKVQKKRVNSRAIDLINAATALQHDLMLVTRNVGDYKDIPSLKIFHEHDTEAP